MPVDPIVSAELGFSVVDGTMFGPNVNVNEVNVISVLVVAVGDESMTGGPRLGPASKFQ